MNILKLNLFRIVYKQSHKSNGFTLIELMVVVVIVATLAAITLIAINPQRQFQQASNTKRVSHVKALFSAIEQYASDHNGNISELNIPEGGVIEARYIADNNPLNNEVDLCQTLTPDYLSTMPADPTNGHYSSCTDYNTGYTVVQATSDNSRKVTIFAPHAENGETISFTR